jgi:single-stranded-DNA-specific exonuclease
MLHHKWKIREVSDPALVANLATALKVREDIAQMLVTRGITDYESARDFFRPSLENLHDPFLMKDMDKAVNRLERALGRWRKSVGVWRL